MVCTISEAGFCAPGAGDPEQLAPSTRILIRADSHYCSPQIIDCANDVDFILGVAPTTTLRKHVADLEGRSLARFEASAKTNKVRRFKEFLDGAASWSRVEHSSPASRSAPRAG